MLYKTSLKIREGALQEHYKVVSSKEKKQEKPKVKETLSQLAHRISKAKTSAEFILREDIDSNFLIWSLRVPNNHLEIKVHCLCILSLRGLSANNSLVGGQYEVEVVVAGVVVQMRTYFCNLVFHLPI